MFSRLKKIWFDKVNGFINGLGFGVKELPQAEPDRTHEFYSRARAREVREMVLVESGTFVLGSFAAGRYDENPASSAAYADAFFIDRYEVTVASFMVCVASGACQPPPGNTGCNWGDDKAAYPVNCVTWQNAADFCQWAGKRLPYEAEWEKAARAGSGKDYFFGDKADDVIMRSPASDEVKAQWRGNKMIGKIRPITLVIRKKADVKTIKSLIDIKAQIQ